MTGASMWSRVTAVVLLVAGLLALSGRPASAHAELVATTPANGAHLDRPPPEVVLRFTESVSPVRNGLRLLDGNGRTVVELTGRAGPRGGSEVVMPLPGSLGDGAYVLSWRVLSADSHPVHGAFVFSVGSVQAAPLADAGARAGADRAVGIAFWLARLLGFVGLAVLVGGAFLVLACWPAGRTDPGVRRVLKPAWIASLVAAVAVLLLQGAEVAGSSLAAVFDPTSVLDTVRTRYGVLLLARIALLVVAGVVLARLGRPETRLSRGRIVAVAVLGSALAMTWSGGGHPSAGTLVALAVVTDAAHLLAMAVWLGGLAMLAALVLRARGGRAPDEASAAVSRFSRWAGVAVAVLGGTGLIQAWRELAAAGIGTQYFSLLVFKVSAFGLLLWLGALSRSVVRRRLLAPAGMPAAPGRRGRARRVEQDTLVGLRRSVRWEVGIAAVVLGLTAALVATPPGGHDHGPAAAAGPAAGPFLGALTLPGTGDVQVWVDPARPGNNQIVLNVRDGLGLNQDVPEVRAQLQLADGNVGPLPVSLAKTGPGQFVANAVLVPIAGTWRLSLQVRTGDFDEATVEAQIPMRS